MNDKPQPRVSMSFSQSELEWLDEALRTVSAGEKPLKSLTTSPEVPRVVRKLRRMADKARSKRAMQ